MAVEGITTTDVNAASEQLRAEMEAYLESHGIDSHDWDIDYGIDITDPAWEAYFRNAYLQYVYMMEPEAINSLEAAVGSDNLNFDTIYANMGDDFNDMVMDMFGSDPEFMGYLAMLDGGESEGDAFLQFLADMHASETSGDGGGEGDIGNTGNTEPSSYATGNLFSGDFGWLYDMEDYYDSSMQSIADQLAELDAAYASLSSQLNDPTANVDAINAELEGNNMQRQMLMAMMGQVNDAKTNYFAMIGEIIKEIGKMSESLVQNYRV